MNPHEHVIEQRQVLMILLEQRSKDLLEAAQCMEILGNERTVEPIALCEYPASVWLRVYDKLVLMTGEKDPEKAIKVLDRRNKAKQLPHEDTVMVLGKGVQELIDLLRELVKDWPTQELSIPIKWCKILDRAKEKLTEMDGALPIMSPPKEESPSPTLSEFKRSMEVAGERCFSEDTRGKSLTEYQFEEASKLFSGQKVTSKACAMCGKDIEVLDQRVYLSKLLPPGIEGYVHSSCWDEYAVKTQTHGMKKSDLEESCIDEAKRIVHGPRRGDYGHPLDNHTCTADHWVTYIMRKYDVEIPLDAEDVCVMNILQKISRYANKRTRDGVVDMIGYAANIDLIDQKRKEGPCEE